MNIVGAVVIFSSSANVLLRFTVILSLVSCVVSFIVSFASENSVASK